MSQHRVLSINETEANVDVEYEDGIYIGLFLCVLTIFVGLLVGYFIRKCNLHWFSEAGVLMLIGMFVGLLVNVTKGGRIEQGMRDLTDFDGHFLFIFLLPPIIFHSGYSTSKESFFLNLIPICALAFVGTFISAVTVALMVYGAGNLDLIYAMTPVESLTFGSLISATDPVTVLAVFDELGVNTKLYAVVFGESVLNDAVAIVMFNTVVEFQDKDIDVKTFFAALGLFLSIFIFSFLIGSIVGCLCALLLKHVDLHKPDAQSFEMTITVLFPYMAYFLAEGLQLSGIVSILFCGFTMAHYANDNLTQDTRLFFDAMFSTLAHISESFIFIYLGMATFSVQEVWTSEFLFALYSLLAVFVARFIAVVPILLLSNLCRIRTTTISLNEIIVIWLSGLRGAIAFSLATKTQVELDNTTSAKVMETATMFITFVTVIVVGGMMPSTTSCLGISRRLSPNDTGESKELEMARMSRNRTNSTTSESSDSTKYSHASRILRNIDHRMIRPILVRKSDTYGGSFVVDSVEEDANDTRGQHANDTRDHHGYEVSRQESQAEYNGATRTVPDTQSSNSFTDDMGLFETVDIPLGGSSGQRQVGGGAPSISLI